LVKRSLALLILCSCATAQPKSAFPGFLAEAYASSLRARPTQATEFGEKSPNDS
jgi:hypothetical protein